MNFHDINLPKSIEIFAVGSSEFSTSIAVSMSGREMRKSDSQIPKRLYSLRNCCLSLDQFESFNNFFQARAGKRFAFRLRDHFDCKVEKQIIAISDGENTEFQLQKIYMDAISPHIRIITKPVDLSVKLWQGGQELTLESIDANNGKVKLTETLPEGVEICASFIFDVPVRFVTDIFQYSFNNDGTIIIENVELMEVYE